MSFFLLCCSTINVDNEIQAIKTLDVKTLSSYPDATIYVYGDPFIKYLKMNWGYGNVSQNNTNFALTDDWIYDYGDYSNNFQYDKSMIIIDD